MSNEVIKTSPTSIITGAVRALRPKQWTKNGLLFAAIIFSYNYTSIDAWIQVLTGFSAFCLLSSVGYVVNDIKDVEADRNHPTKKNRPIASGALPVKAAIVEAILICVLGFAVAATLGWQFLLVTALYFVTTTSYSFFFKHLVILDIMMITAGFLWRAVAGAVAIDVTVSSWLLLCAAFFAMFLGFNKRRGELSLLEEAAESHRKNLKDYSLDILKEFQSITTSGTIISYALYTVLGSPTDWLLITLPFVLYGIFRYIYLVNKFKGEGGAPDEILVKDKPILFTVLLYLLTVVAVLMLAPH